MKFDGGGSYCVGGGFLCMADCWKIELFFRVEKLEGFVVVGG